MKIKNFIRKVNYSDFKYTHTDQINNNGCYSIVPVMKYHNLKKSVEECGILFPLIVDRGLVLVSGHSRLRAAVETGLTSVPVLIADGDAVDLFNINMVHTFHSGIDPGDGARAVCIRRLVKDFDVRDQTLVNEYLPMLGCERSRKIAEDLKSFAEFSESVLSCFVKNGLSLRTARIFFPYSAEDREYVCAQLGQLNAGENRLRKVGEWLWHIGRRNHAHPADILKNALYELQKNRRPLTIKELETVLSVQRNPVISGRNLENHSP